MRDDVREKRSVKPEHLEVLLLLNRQVIFTIDETTSAQRTSLNYLTNLGMAIYSQRKNPEQPTENQPYWRITDEGEEYCLEYNHRLGGSS
jgi:hypothetical protein